MLDLIISYRKSMFLPYRFRLTCENAPFSIERLPNKTKTMDEIQQRSCKLHLNSNKGSVWVSTLFEIALQSKTNVTMTHKSGRWHVLAASEWKNGTLQNVGHFSFRFLEFWCHNARGRRRVWGLSCIAALSCYSTLNLSHAR